jgi:uncharacterized repeat protein (TIGR01451 family)
VGNGPLDWNCDGDTLDSGVNNDINGDGLTNTLTGFDDWNNLLFDFQRTGSFADGDHSQSIKVIEADVDDFIQQIAPDLEITKTASPDPVLTGSNVTYSIAVRNKRPDAATSVVVTDLLPAATSFVSCSANGGGVCGGLSNMRTVSFATIPGGTTVNIQIVAAVTCSLANGTVLTNAATVSSSSIDADLSNNSANASTTASNPPPVISNEAVNTPTLLTPNHVMNDVTVSYDVTDNCGPVTNTLTVQSNEPVNGLGDGDTAPDWVVVDSRHVRLRAERSGTGTGRIYTITITATDSAGNSSSKQVFVTVPHSRRAVVTHAPIKGPRSGQQATVNHGRAAGGALVPIPQSLRKTYNGTQSLKR